MDDYLAHHGVKGMKWGVRKRPVSSAKKSSSSKKSNAIKELLKRKSRKKTAKKATQKSASKEKSVRKMTDAELDKRIARLQKEKLYKDLKKSNMSTGKRVVQNIVTRSVENVGTQLATYAFGTGVNKIVGKDIINVGGKKKKDKS